MVLQRRFLIILAIMIFGLGLSACSKTKEYTVTFDTNGGSEISSVKTDGTSAISVTNIPVKEGFDFEGWYTDAAFSQEYNGKTIVTENMTLYARWSVTIYEITYHLNGGENAVSNHTTFVYGTTSLTLTDPTKAESTFDGWYTDANCTIPFITTNIPSSNIILYAKWIESNPVIDSLTTAITGLHSSLYGNTNGNLHNLGLATYDSVLALHYYSYGSNVFSYDPATESTKLVLSLTTGGRATYLNLDGDILYYIDSSNGYLMSYNLINHVFTAISETENIYASLRSGDWVNYIYPEESYGSVYMSMYRYNIDTKASSRATTGAEQISLDGTRVYYKTVNALELRVMNYSGNGKSTIVYLNNFDVDTIHESLLLDVNYDYTAFYALILTIGDSTGLYLYNSLDNELVEILDIGNGLHSLNTDGTNLYVLSASSNLYKINLETHESEVLKTLSDNAAYLQIINHWIYVGTADGISLLRIHPDTNEIDYLNYN